MNHILVTSKTELTPGFLNTLYSKGLSYVHYKLYPYFCNPALHFPALQQHDMLLFDLSFTCALHSCSRVITPVSCSLFCMSDESCIASYLAHAPLNIIPFFTNCFCSLLNCFHLLSFPAAYILCPTPILLYFLVKLLRTVLNRSGSRADLCESPFSTSF